MRKRDLRAEKTKLEDEEKSAASWGLMRPPGLDQLWDCSDRNRLHEDKWMTAEHLLFLSPVCLCVFEGSL